MRRYILTGAPGAGKTSILRALEARGLAVVEEAATHVNELMLARGVAEPWLQPDFIDAIVDLQKRRREAAGRLPGEAQVHDRSPICTLALCRQIQRPVPPSLVAELERIESEATFERRVLFVGEQGFITATEVRRISYEDSLRFEALHREAYQERGYDLVEIPRGPLDQRVDGALSAMGLEGPPLPDSEQAV
jgi:predicted ATPase